MSAAAAGNNDTVMNFIAQKLVCSGKIKIRLKILIRRLREINYFEKCSTWTISEELYYTREIKEALAGTGRHWQALAGTGRHWLALLHYSTELN